MTLYDVETRPDQLLYTIGCCNAPGLCGKWKWIKVNKNENLHGAKCVILDVPVDDPT
jgi:hypothetical protein